MNPSKTGDPRFWRRWHASGAVAKEQFPDGSLVIDAIGTHVSGPHEGYQTLTLGRTAILGGHGYEPLCAVVVPQSEKFDLGLVLPRIPGNAVPTAIFFAN